MRSLEWAQILSDLCPYKKRKFGYRRSWIEDGVKIQGECHGGGRDWICDATSHGILGLWRQAGTWDPFLESLAPWTNTSLEQHSTKKGTKKKLHVCTAGVITDNKIQKGYKPNLHFWAKAWGTTHGICTHSPVKGMGRPPKPPLGTNSHICSYLPST